MQLPNKNARIPVFSRDVCFFYIIYHQTYRFRKVGVQIPNFELVCCRMELFEYYIPWKLTWISPKMVRWKKVTPFRNMVIFWCPMLVFGMFFHVVVPPKASMSSENQWLEDEFSFWTSPFLGDSRSFSGRVSQFIRFRSSLSCERPSGPLWEISSANSPKACFLEVSLAANGTYLDVPGRQ